MKYRPGIVGEGSGSMGSMTFSRNRFGPYIKQRAAAVNPNSQRQQAVRSVWQALSNAWKNLLAEANRESWRIYAANVPVKDAFGSDIFLTGYSMFMRSNTVGLGASLARIDPGPSNFTLGDADETMVGTVSEATQTISVSFDDSRSWVSDDGAVMQIQMSRPVNDSVEFIPPVYRIADYIPGDSVTPPTSPVSMDVPFPVAEDQKVLVVGRILEADGRLSNHFQSTVSVGA